MNESYEEHRERDGQSWGGFFLALWLFPSLRWVIPVLFVAVGGIWLLNVLGDSTALNDPEIIYSNKDPVTGEIKWTKGCRVERLMPDGTCDKSISIDTIRRGFPFVGDAKDVPRK